MIRTRLFRRKLRANKEVPYTASELWEKVKATARELERLGLEWNIALRAARAMHGDQDG